MSDTLEIFGTEYTGVTGIKATNDNNNILTFYYAEDGDDIGYGEVPNLRNTEWYFNEVPSYAESFTYETPTETLFRNGNSGYRGIYYDKDNVSLKYGVYTGSPTLSKTNAYTNGSWSTGTRTITFADTDITDSSLVAFIQANATEVV